MHRTLMIVVVFGMVSTAACGSDPVDVAGDYSLSLTNHENACMFPNWNENATTTGVQMTLTQNGSSVSATAGGLVAPALDIPDRATAGPLPNDGPSIGPIHVGDVARFVSLEQPKHLRWRQGVLHQTPRASGDQTYLCIWS